MDRLTNTEHSGQSILICGLHIVCGFQNGSHIKSSTWKSTSSIGEGWMLMLGSVCFYWIWFNYRGWFYLVVVIVLSCI